MRASTVGTRRRSIAALWIALVATTAGLHAQSAPPPVDATLRARFGFVGPQIEKVGDGIGRLRCADLDGDGRNEIVFEDPRRARLEIRTVTGDRLDARSDPTRGSLSGVAIADFDHDGKADVAMLDARGRLRVQLRDPKAEAREPFDVGLAATGDAVRAADLDGDGAADLVVRTKDGIRVVTKVATAPTVAPAMPLDDEAVRAFHLHDVDGDGHQDLVVAVGTDRMPLRIKRGHGDGTFGPWLILDVPELRTVFPGTGAGGVATLAAIEGPHRRVVEYAMREDARGSALELTALPDTRSKGALPFATGDVDGDGDADLVVALPDRASLALLLDDDGRFSLRSVPTLAGVSSVAIGDVDGDGRDDLVVASPDEATIAWKAGTAPLDAFPTRLPTTDLPVAVAVHDGRIFAICRNERRDASAVEVRLDAPLPRPLCQLGRLPADPLRLLAANVDPEPGVELAYVVPGDGLVVLTDLAAESARKLDADAGFTKKMDDGSLALTASESPALLVARDRYVRRFRFDAAGKANVLAQDNGPEGAEGIQLVATTPQGGTLMYDRKGDRLYRVARDGSLASIDVPPLGFTHLLAFGNHAVLLGPRGVLRIPFGRGYALAAVRTHEPPTDDTTYWDGLAADLDGDGTRELAMLDADIHGIQVLCADGPELRRALAFPMFEVHDTSEDMAEPRELAAADVDGDGRDDLLAICFDRLLVYLQER